MKVIVGNMEGFTNEVFGADSFLEHYPELQTTGVELKRFPDTPHWYMVDEDGRALNDTAFFSQEEMRHLEIISV